MRSKLSDIRPDLAAQWHPTLNGELTPHEVTAGSGRRVWWQDEHGHEWQSTVNNRSHGTGCPYCSNTRVLAGFNDLASQRPAIAMDWHPTLNGDWRPDQVAPQSGQTAWWKCSDGHDYRMTVGNRTAGGEGCPICAGQRVLPGFNDMATTTPTLAAEWHPTRNGTVTPCDVFRSTARRFWWQDVLGHEWEASANERSNGSGCPFCSGQRILVGFNDLATRRPELAGEWHPTLNGDRTAQMVTIMNGTRAWWRCSDGHEWEAVVSSRSAGNGCPVCAGQTVVQGRNDLASRAPAVARSWHPTRNGDATSSTIAVFSNRKVWWLCPQGHEWASTVNNRSHGQGCPECAEHGFNPGRPGYVYFLEHPTLRALKVGITNVDTTRLAMFQTLGWIVVSLELFQRGSDALIVETAVKNWWRVDLRLPVWLGAEDMAQTGGWTETINCDALTSFECVERIRRERVAAESGVANR